MTLSRRERLVVDASIAIKWVVPEPGSAQAISVLDHELVVPDLLFPQCANILWRKIRHNELSEDEAEIAAAALEQADLSVVATRGYLARAVAIAAELDHPAYDGIYLAVAEALGLRFVTADDRLVRKLDQRPSSWRRTVVALSEID